MFVVDISASMKGSPLENVKNALVGSLSQLNPQDRFNIIAFNGEAYLFSQSMEPATVEAILKAAKWVDTTFIANGGTNIMLPLTQVILINLHFPNDVPSFLTSWLVNQNLSYFLMSLYNLLIMLTMTVEGRWIAGMEYFPYIK